MQRRFRWSMGLVVFLSLTSCAAGYRQNQPYAQAGAPREPVSISYFYDSLSPDGQWFQDPNYGWCWTPYDVAEDWRPYSDGWWAYTDEGWSWSSNESFGWATYHYGRWFFDDSYGWAWVPGTEWAPAWVAWRSGDDWVGWAPLPPAARWDDASGLDYADAGAIPSDEWCFVPRSHLLDANLTLQLTSVGRNVTLLEGSHDATRFEAREGHPIDLGIDVTVFENSIGRPVPRQRIVDVDAPSRGDRRTASGGDVGFFRPAVHPVAPDQTPAPRIWSRPSPIADADMQRVRDEQQRRLESDLAAERARLVRDQQNELRTQAAGSAADAIRQRHVLEQQAFDAHAARQRQVLGQRMQKQVVRPSRGKGADKQNNGRGKGNGKGNQ